jgi:aminoglycoside phosphotransferase (APT) family kinase protein
VTAPPTPDEADLADRLGRVMRRRIEGLVRLSGGASRETWAFDAVDPSTNARQELILRRDPPGAPRDGMELEARILRAASAAGVLTPPVRAAGSADPTRLVTSYLIMDRIAGETIARRIQREPELANAREVLVGQCGTSLARLHSIDPTSIAGLERLNPIDRYRGLYRELGYQVPTFDLAFAWLDEHRLVDRREVVVHGDFRLGNLIVSGEGLASVLDWELAHVGDPMEDLAWLSIRAWRFGGDQPVAGIGTVEQLFEAYATAGGSVDQAAFDWWMVAGTLMWGVMCIMQTNAHLSGAIRSVELAAIGRRVVEQEHDLLLLLDPANLESAKQRFVLGRAPRKVEASRKIEAPHEAGAEAEARAVEDRSDAYGLPSATILLEAVREFLERDVMTSTVGRVQFHARVAMNVLSMVERQLQAAPLTGELAVDVVARLAVANPKHFTQ